MLLVITSLFCEKKSPIDFFKEDIRIEIYKNRAQVTGIYFFKNLSSVAKRIKLYYPFPLDSIHYYPDTILLAYPYEKDSAGIYFTMVIRSNSIDSFKIFYEQRLRQSQFRYITTTTKKWHRPIKEARFTVVLASDFLPVINYPINRKEIIGKWQYYYIINKRFYPNEDLIIKW